MVLETIHKKHPGRAGIHSEIVGQAQLCRHGTEKGKDLKPLTPKSQSLKLLPLSEPNEEVHMDLAGTIPLKDNIKSNYILVTGDRLSRYPHAESFNACDTKLL